MAFTSSFIRSTPKAVKILIGATLGTSLLVSLCSLISPLLGVQLFSLLGLSLTTLKSGFVWQLLSYLFVLPSSGALTGSFFISALFNGFLLWVVATTLSSELGTKRFLKLYFTCGLAGGLAAMLLAFATRSSEIILGPLGAIYAALLVWTLLFANLRLRLFFVFNVKARWLVLGLIALNVLDHLSTRHWCAAVGMLASVLMGYVYGNALKKRAKI